MRSWWKKVPCHMHSTGSNMRESYSYDDARKTAFTPREAVEIGWTAHAALFACADPRGRTYNVLRLIESGVLLNVRDCVLFLRTHGLLVKKMKCRRCSKVMREEKTTTTDDGFRWRCNPCDTTSTIRKYSIFANSNVQLPELLMLFYFWAHDALQTQIAHEAEISQRSTVVWCGRLRKICSAEFRRKKRPLGGFGSTIVIDEMHLAKRRAASTGRAAVKAIWAFGGIDRDTREMFVEITADRTAEVFRKLIGENVANGSTILTDAYPSYKGIESWGREYKHGVVDHSSGYKSPQGCHTNDVEQCWCAMRYHLHRSRGLARHLLADYVGEWLWKRQHQKTDRFLALLRTIHNDPRYRFDKHDASPAGLSLWTLPLIHGRTWQNLLFCVFTDNKLKSISDNN